MTTYSDAAHEYTTGIDPRVHLNWGIVRAAFDAGAASAVVEIAKVWLKGEPERLTDPDDPRIKDDATYELRENKPQSARGIRKCLLEGCHEVHLIAPAPDLDADALQAITNVLIEIGIDIADAVDDAPVVLAGLRDRGVAK